MDDRFYNGVIGASTKVCGYKIDALTPWHHLLLAAIDSPVMETSRSTEVDDLLVFLKIAQAQWPEVPELKPTMRDYWWHWRMGKVKVAKQEMAKCKDWLMVQLSIPQFWQKDGGTPRNTSNLPGILGIVTGLVCKGNFQLADVWNMSMAAARWYEAGVAQLNGAELKLVDENEPMPEVKEMTDAEAVEQARKNLPPELFDRWFAAFKEKQKGCKV